MKKRLRKKLRLGEFQEFGFSIAFRMSSTLSTKDRDVLLDAFIDMIEQNGLQFGGGGLNDWEGFVNLDSRGTATEQHRQVVHEWLDGHPQVEDVVVGQLVDVWHTRD
jgi:uncharacterized protein